MKYTITRESFSTSGVFNSETETYIDQSDDARVPLPEEFIEADLTGTSSDLVKPYTSTSSFIDKYTESKYGTSNGYNENIFLFGVKSIIGEGIGGNWKFVVYQRNSDNRCYWSNGFDSKDGSLIPENKQEIK